MAARRDDCKRATQLGNPVTMEGVTSANYKVAMDSYPGCKLSKGKGQSLPIDQVQAAMKHYIPPDGYEVVHVFSKVGLGIA